MKTTKLTTNTFLFLILAGIILGAVVGGVFPKAGREIAFLGDLFLKALLMLVVPLVMASLIVGITGLGDVRKLGGIGGRTIAYYMATTAISVIIGIILVVIISPGKADTVEERLVLRGGAEQTEAQYSIQGNKISFDKPFKQTFDDRYMVILLDQKIRGEFPENVKLESGQTMIRVKDWKTVGDRKDAVPEATGTGIRMDLAIAGKVAGKETRTIWDAMKDMILGLVPKNLFDAMVNNKILPLIVFSLFFGAVLTMIGDRGKPVIHFFEGINEAIMSIVGLLMLTAPIGVGALIAGKLGDAGGFSEFMPILIGIGKYALTVIIGLLIHALVILPLMLKFLGKRDVFKFAKGMLAALTTAFSTASSSATLPTTINCTTTNNGVSERTSSFVLPLGATINMDGTALYEAVAAIFIAQIYGIDLDIGHMIIIFLTSTLAAIGAAGIPEAGLVTMVLVLTSVGLPVEGISLLLPIDWFLDRCRTTLNVWGDSVGAAVIDAGEANASPTEPEAA